MINTLIIGLSLGCIYGFVAMGFALVYRTTGVMNFAQGAFVMLGGVGAGYSAHAWGWPWLASAAFAVVLSGFAGLVLAVGVVIPLWSRKASAFVTILGTLLFLVAAENIVLNLVGSDPFAVDRVVDKKFSFPGGSIDAQSIVIVGTTIVIAIALDLVLTRTKWGLAMRAVSTDQKTARLLGISPRKVAILAFVITAVIAGIGGLLIAPLQLAAWNVAQAYNIKGFIAAVLGGLVDIRAALIGGIVVGLGEAFIGMYLSTTYLEVFLLAVLLVLLFLKPTGLFTPSTKKVKSETS
jgi:branched-chain amino acid transport system permease protein